MKIIGKTSATTLIVEMTEYEWHKLNGPIKISSSEFNLKSYEINGLSDLVGEIFGQLPDIEHIAQNKNRFCELMSYAFWGFSDNQRMALEIRFRLLDNDKKNTYNKVGEELGVSVGRARQVIEKTLRYLRHPKRSNPLREFIK